MQQRTIASQITQTGTGLHTDIKTNVRILPAEPGSGRYFVRVDLPSKPTIWANIKSVSQTVLSTELREGEASVRTVEHLLASVAAMGVSNARIEIDGPEVPVLDGSARIWAENIAKVGTVEQNSTVPQNALSLEKPIWVRQEDTFVCALPAPQTRFSYGIDFDLPTIGYQWHSWMPANDQQNSYESFITEIAPARTFGLMHQIEHLKKSGLIKGGSLENALVCGEDGLAIPPLRFPNEPVRHKILDLVGDLSLLGIFPRVHFLAYKASHNLHIQLAKRILEQESLDF